MLGYISKSEVIHKDDMVKNKMSEDLNKIGKKAKIAFQRKISTKLKNKVLIDFYNLIKKNKKNYF